MEKFVYDKDRLPKPYLPKHKDWLKLYDKAWELAFQNIEYIDNKNWKPQLTCMPGAGIVWQWDSCIMTFITNYSNGIFSAFNNLDNMYRLQNPNNGFMAMAYRIKEEDEAYPGRINPPLMAFAEWEHYVISGDGSRLPSVTPRLEKFYNYIEKNRTRSCGLYWFEDTGSSGMDNSPRSGYFSSTLNGSDVCFIDLACQQALSAYCLSKMFSVIGDSAKAEFFALEHKRIVDLINKYHWSDKTGFYYDFFARNSASLKVKLINTKTGAAFWTLVSGVAFGDRADAVISHLMNDEEFNTKIPFATLSKDDLNYDRTGGFWLGGVWAPTNFAAIRGLEKVGKIELAKEVSIKYLDGMCRVFENPKYNTIWETYAPEEYLPGTTETGGSCGKDFVGWSGIAPITLLIETIIGLKFNAIENTVTFTVSEGEIGLNNFLFGGKKISVICTKYDEINKKATVEVESEKEFTLVIKPKYDGYKEQKFAVKLCKNVFEI